MMKIMLLAALLAMFIVAAVPAVQRKRRVPKQKAGISFRNSSSVR